MFKAVFFDVDGVLVDSLAPHLQITRDFGTDFGICVTVPTVDEFRKLVRIRPVSPMKAFFTACGFPEAQAAVADDRYRAEFAAKYLPALFPGVSEMLERLAVQGIPMGIATLNTLRNITPSLGETMRHFHDQCRYEGQDARARTKADALVHGAGALGLKPAEVLLVGDQLSDYEAASGAGAQFLGVTYGWGINESDSDFPVVTSVEAVGDYVLSHVMRESLAKD